MRKIATIISVVLLLVMALSLVACASEENVPTTTSALQEVEHAPTPNQLRAVEEANSLLEGMYMSKLELDGEMTLNGYRVIDIDYALRTIDVDWNEMAYKRGTYILSLMKMDEEGLREQLDNACFTKENIDYAIAKIYK